MLHTAHLFPQDMTTVYITGIVYEVCHYGLSLILHYFPLLDTNAKNLVLHSSHFALN